MLGIRNLVAMAGCLALIMPVGAWAQDQGQNEKPDEEPAQLAFPETEIFLLDYDPSDQDDPLSGAMNITSRSGYDNQPAFSPDARTILYSRDDGTQTDIWEYDIANQSHTQITDTPNSEFSPTPSPDNRTISFVMDPPSSVWQIDRSAPASPSWVLEPTGIAEPIGYFARSFENGNLLFWSRYGFAIKLVDVEARRLHFVSGNAVPSTPRMIPGSELFSFVHRQANEEVWIKSLDPATRAVTPLVRIVGANANYAWTPDGALLQIEGDTLYRWRKGEDGWMAHSDLANHGITSAGRIAISPDGRRIAIVGLPKE